MFNSAMTMGDLLTALAVLVSAMGILAELRKDHNLRRKEVADKVRRSAGLIVAKVHRWKDLSQNFFDSIQPLITDADASIVLEKDVIKVRDLFWRETFDLRASIKRQIMEEQIEVAYADLYGYDTRIHELYSEVLARLRAIEENSFKGLLRSTQEDILSFERALSSLCSAQLGNKLRQTTKSFAEESGSRIDAVLLPFRVEMEKLVNASDEDISARRLPIVGASVLPEMSEDSPLLILTLESDLRLPSERCEYTPRPSHVGWSGPPPRGDEETE